MAWHTLQLICLWLSLFLPKNFWRRPQDESGSAGMAQSCTRAVLMITLSLDSQLHPCAVFFNALTIPSWILQGPLSVKPWNGFPFVLLVFASLGLPPCGWGLDLSDMSALQIHAVADALLIGMAGTSTSASTEPQEETQLYTTQGQFHLDLISVTARRGDKNWSSL